MNIKTMSYRRTKNLGNYQSETVEMTAEVDKTDDPDTVFAQLKNTTLDYLDIEHDVEDEE
jgi:hypothetical protein